MKFKTIMVNLNHEARVPELIAAAAVLARPANAHVVGLYVTPPLLMPGEMVVPMDSGFYDQQIESHRAQANRIKAVFEAAVKGETYVAEWRVHADAYNPYQAIADGLIRESRAAELVIVSQATSGKEPSILTEIPQRVALESGRPVLIVPSNWRPAEYGRDIAIAWNDSRESARAAFDAMPLLAGSKKIRLLTAGEFKDSDGVNTIPSAEVAATLARHGLNVDVETITGAGRHVGSAILSRVTSGGSDLLVMGAYGHSRMREFLLGGATRDVLKGMTVPVFMSH